MDRLRAAAPAYVEVALANIAREFPAGVAHTMRGPGDFPQPRERNPSFYGSFDWHSCVEMHWLLVRLLAVAADAFDVAPVRAALDEHLAADPLAVEAAFMAGPERGRQRPYGWGWGLTLVTEVKRLAAAGDQHASRWAEHLAPLAAALTTNYTDWLGSATYPVRYGLHPNSAFGLSRALAHAETLASAGDPRLRDAVTAAATRWFGDDAGYGAAAAWEPSGHDFLSPALVEAELMSRVLDPEPFVEWLGAFMGDLADERPATLFAPVVVSDPTDGQIAHLHGLNLSRAWCWRRVADALPPGDDRRPPLLAASARHADAALPHVVGDDYMVEHWLAADAVLLLTEPRRGDH